MTFVTVIFSLLDCIIKEKQELKMLKNRVQKAKAAQKFIKILQRDQAGRPTSLLVPGSEGKQYEVILRRKYGKFTGECRLMVGGQGYHDCKGNSNGTVCYHVLAAVIFAANYVNRQVKFCQTDENAKLLSRTGGQVLEVGSHQGIGVLYAVVQ